MKPHEVRGLPIEEIKSMLADAETNLIQMRFNHAVGQLENKLALRETRKEIAILKTLIREEELKNSLSQAEGLLKDLAVKMQMPELSGMMQVEKQNNKKAQLRKAVRILSANPKIKQFTKEYGALKQIAR
jgi:large subunit ribosomal protein L29